MPWGAEEFDSTGTEPHKFPREVVRENCPIFWQVPRLTISSRCPIQYGKIQASKETSNSAVIEINIPKGGDLKSGRGLLRDF
jgi:hypothetical protein